MANFQYKAVNFEKKFVEGVVSAISREEAASILTKRSLTPLSVKELVGKSNVHGSIPAIEKITFCRYMGYCSKMHG